ncbi:diacylglycerol kinase family protein [Paenibacillus thailandensis]|uniref:diacylglycerol kinase family protein n=1 Tax=Paenibacillus thailandensis TaxID=393250 RepID=UPI00363F2A91
MCGSACWSGRCFAYDGRVIAAELINTAIEKAVDLASPAVHPLAKAAKDTAAGAVLFWRLRLRLSV